MSVSKRAIEFESLDLAAFLVAAGYEVSVYRNPEGRRALFSFSETDGLHSAIVGYERGTSLPAKRLLNARSYLFRLASRVVKEGSNDHA